MDWNAAAGIAFLIVNRPIAALSSFVSCQIFFRSVFRTTHQRNIRIGERIASSEDILFRKNKELGTKYVWHATCNVLG